MPWAAFLSPASAVAAILAIVADYRGPRWLHYCCKPLATVLILALALSIDRGDGRGYTALIALGLACSLVGDICLMLPQDRFIAGLLSFLLAHLAYIVAFSRAAPVAWGGTALLTFAPLLVYGSAIFLPLRSRLGPLTVPVLGYMLVILLMAWRAIEYARQYPAPGSLLAASGALLFLISDSALARNRFARPFRAAQALVLGTYFIAQWLIALSH
jgi:uncharacterized membrane protein YhhN